MVDSADDSVTADGACTLREAIINANNDNQSGSTDCAAGSGADVITFAADYTITLGSQLPAVTSQIAITGNGAANTIVQANAAPNTATYRVFEVSAAGNLTLDGLTVRHGRCNDSCTTNPYNGGGIYNEGGTLTVTNSALSGNSADNGGGGIYNYSGTVTVTNSALSNNSAGYGGGIYSDNYSTVTVTNSTISGNNATSTNGGGIFNYYQSTLTVANSTFSGNSANINGGGIHNAYSGTLTVTNSTLSGNSANNFGGGIYNNLLATMNYSNTIIANSAAGGDCSNGGTIGANVNNLVENGSCSPTFSGDPNLGPLQDNGGPTQTHALLTGSAAIDAGNAAVCATAPVNNLDQRGVARPQGAACDIGAYEYVDITPPVVMSITRANTNP
ncbi:MAG: hypothetical protein DCC54_07320, partial [Anaerolineae bacterium]